MNKNHAFIIGSRAAAAAGKCSPRYACPLCLRSFFEFDPSVLTEEHVPAKVVGGKGLLLVCRDCNSEAGSNIQSHQAERAKQTKFWSGESRDTSNFEVRTPLGILRGEGTHDGSGNVRLNIHKGRMDPATIQAFEENSENVTYEGYEAGRRFDWRKARIADLRDAYLWVFARWGYRAIAVPYFEWVRDAIRDGHTERQKWSIHLNDPYTSATQKKVGRAVICFLDKPKGALLICHGESGVILPTFLNEDPYSDLGDAQANVEIAKDCMPVPTSMIMGFDFSDHLFE